LVERKADINLPEVEYIETSLALQTRLQKERQRRRQWTVLGLVGGLMIALVLAGLAFYQRQNALRQAAVLLAGQAETELANGYHDRAVLLALAALENYPYTSQAEHALGQVVSYNRALQQLAVHQSAVTSAAWSPDGKRVASSGAIDNNVHIWDPVTGEMILVIDMPKGISGNKRDMALNVLWTPDGERLLTLTGDRYSLGSQDYDLLVWNAVNGELLSSLEIPNQAEPESGDLGVTFVNYPTGAALEIAPHSGQLATLGGDNTALIWDAAWQKPVFVLSGHTMDVNSVDWSPDETRLVTASLDGTAIIWDAQTGKALHTLAGHQGSVNLALWSPDGNQIATAGEDSTLRIWNAVDGKLVRNIETNSDALSSLVWTSDSVRLISGQRDGSLRIWEVASGKLLETLRGHQSIISDLEWSPVDDRLVSVDGYGYARIWKAAPSTAWRLFPSYAVQGEGWVTGCGGASWSSDGRYLSCAGGNNMVSAYPPSFNIWDVQANQVIMKKLVDPLHLYGLESHFSPDNQSILYIGTGFFPDFSPLATAYIFDARSGEIIRTFTPGGEDLIRSAAWSPDGSQVATGLFNGDILIWDFQSGEQIHRLIHDNNGYMTNYVEWSPDGSKIAGATDASNAHVWDARTWEPLYSLQHEPPTFVCTSAWSPDGTRLLTTAGNDEQGAKDNTARIWDTSTGKELLVFNGHTQSVWPGSWSPDGKRVVTGSNDDTVRIWDSSTGDELLTISTPVSYGVFTWWSPDGQHIFISSVPASVWRVWQSTEELVEYAKECCVIRQLTDAERQKFGLP
jgi:WD40 repeat protein